MSRQYTVDQLKNFGFELRRMLGIENTPRPDMRHVLRQMEKLFPDFKYSRVRNDDVQEGEGFYDPAAGLQIPDKIFEALDLT